MSFGLNPDTVKQIHAVCQRYPQIEAVILYGSRAMGTYSEGSDIDLTLKGKHIDLSVLTKFVNELDDLLLPYIFDVSLFDDIENKALLSHIARVGKVFYQYDNSQGRN